ncbi:MauE/DoxX family redox-associated membrane protein [Kribbella sp. NPDC056861]|uniref:MauE/DoxX family redox-associated membrane protein n=1 Tax=Kribbella sp. NPDC056861 TaxID=3154857 RepID=UPI00341CA62F
MELIATFGLAAALLLLLAASRRATGSGGLTEVVRQHGLLPDRLARQAPLGTALEAVAGLAVIVAWLAGLSGVLRIAAAVVAGWYLLLAIYLAVLLRKRGPVPCGCLDDKSPVSRLKVGRAGLLAVASVVLAAGLEAPSGLGFRLLYVVLGGFVVLLLTTTDQVAELVSGPK